MVLKLRLNVLYGRSPFTALTDWFCITEMETVYCAVCKPDMFRLWYLSNRQIHEDLGVPFFADHIRALTASFDLRLADVGNPLVRQLGRYLLWPRVSPVARSVNRERRVAKSAKRIVLGSDLPSTFRLP